MALFSHPGNNLLTLPWYLVQDDDDGENQILNAALVVIENIWKTYIDMN